MHRLVGNRVECNGCIWWKAYNALARCPNDQRLAECRKKGDKEVWTGLLLASVELLQVCASHMTWNRQVTLVCSVGLHLTVYMSTVPVTLLDLQWTAGNRTLKDLKQIDNFQQCLFIKHQSAITSILIPQWSHIWQSYHYLLFHICVHLFTVSVTQKCLTTIV